MQITMSSSNCLRTKLQPVLSLFHSIMLRCKFIIYNLSYKYIVLLSLLLMLTVWSICPFWTSSYPRSPNLRQNAVVDCVGKPLIFIQCSCLIAPPRGYKSALWRTRLLLPNTGRKITDWLLSGFIQCANIQALLARSITASVHKFGGCGYDNVFGQLMYMFSNIHCLI